MNLLRRLFPVAAVATITLFAAKAHATSIVAIKTGDDIFIGTDSKMLIEKDVAVNQCKITRFGDVYLVFSGIPSLPASNFNAYEIAQKIFSGKGTINDRLTLFDRAVSAKLQEAFEKLRTTDDKLFSRWYTEDVGTRIAMQMLVAGPEKKRTVLAMLEYRIASKKNEPVKLETIKQNIVTQPGSDRPKILFLGMQDAINVLKKRKDFLSNFDEVSKINEWITAEAKANPALVSGPVDIIKISPKKTEWIQHKDICPEIDGPKPKAAPAKK